MKDYMVNIFVRVIKRKMDSEGRTSIDILDNDYSNLAQTDKDSILNKI
jgi:hypothetical protein